MLWPLLLSAVAPLAALLTHRWALAALLNLRFIDFREAERQFFTWACQITIKSPKRNTDMSGPNFFLSQCFLKNYSKTKVFRSS